jgi:hypothetical protein
MEAYMTPRLTTIWKNRADLVVNYIMANPGATGKEIAYKTNVALPTVHLIIQHDPRAFALAREGKVAVHSRHIKPGWYHPSMTLVPIVKQDRLTKEACGVDLKKLIANQNYAPNIVKTLDQVIDLVAMGVANPGRSVVRRKKDAQKIISHAQLMGSQYTAVKAQNDEVIPRLANLETVMLRLTAAESLENRFGKPQLRKKAV